MGSSYTIVALLALAATGFFSLSTAMKHRTATRTPRERGPRGLGRFLLATARHPAWLAALGADVGGVTLQVTALHLGPLSVVQPVMITALLFSLVLTHAFDRTRIPGREALGGAALVTGLVGFLAVSGASSPRVTGPAMTADRAPGLAFGIVALMAAVFCVLLARRLPGGRSAAALGIAVGIVYACTAALIKGCSDVAVSSGVLAVLASWQLYLVLVVGLAGLVLSQLAFRAGPLTASLPAIAVVDPLLSIALGVIVYDERLRPGLLPLTGAAICVAGLCAAAIYLSRLGATQHPATSVDPATK